MSHPQIRNIPHKLTQRSKSSDTAAIEGATQRKSPQRRIESPYLTMRLEAIRSIMTISCRCYPKSVWKTSA